METKCFINRKMHSIKETQEYAAFRELFVYAKENGSLGKAGGRQD